MHAHLRGRTVILCARVSVITEWRVGTGAGLWVAGADLAVYFGAGDGLNETVARLGAAPCSVAGIGRNAGIFHHVGPGPSVEGQQLARSNRADGVFGTGYERLMEALTQLCIAGVYRAGNEVIALPATPATPIVPAFLAFAVGDADVLDLRLKHHIGVTVERVKPSIRARACSVSSRVLMGSVSEYARCVVAACGNE